MTGEVIVLAVFGLPLGIFLISLATMLMKEVTTYNKLITVYYSRYDNIRGHIFETESGKELGVRGRFNLVNKRVKDEWLNNRTPFKLYVNKTEDTKVGLSDKSSLVVSSLICYITGILCIGIPAILIVNLMK